VSRPTLDDNELMQTAFSGFSYPNNAQVVALLGDGTTPGGNAVLQQSALTLRQATVSWVAASPAEVATIRALYESKESVEYVDHDGNTTDVRVLDMSSAVMVGDYWSCSATLIEAG
jgi:hypothetical protein